MPLTPDAPETPDYELPPDAQDLDLGNVVIHKAARPYVTEWFNDTKKPGDTPLQFLLRMIYQAAANHRARKLVQANRGSQADFDEAVDPGDPATFPTTHAGQAAMYEADVEESRTTALAQLEGILP